jgi:hypothetical protein
LCWSASGNRAPPAADSGRLVVPYLFEFEPAQGILRCAMSGHITDRQLLECHKLGARYVRQKNPAISIVDLSAVSSIEVSPATVKDLARSEPALAASRPRFIVAPDDHLYGMSRMYQLTGEGIRPMLQVVRSLAEVYAAVGFRELQFEPLPDS